MNKLSPGQIEGWTKEITSLCEISGGIAFRNGDDWSWPKEHEARREFEENELNKLRSGETPLMCPNDLKDKVKSLNSARGYITAHVLVREVLAVRASLKRYAELN